MTGRIIHTQTGELIRQPYSMDDSEFVHSISRTQLVKLLMDEAEKTQSVKIHCNHTAIGMDFDAGVVSINDESSEQVLRLAAAVVIATDGAGSAIRNDVMRQSGFTCGERGSGYGVKELEIRAEPARHNGSPLVERNALHLWPRKAGLLLASPHHDHGFALTLFLPLEGPLSFGTLKTASDVKKVFAEHFPDVAPLVDNLTESFFKHPAVPMVTVKCYPWNMEEKCSCWAVPHTPSFLLPVMPLIATSRM